MTNTNEAIRVRMGDLDVGARFDELEVIVSISGNSMDTVRWDVGVEGGREYDMRLFHYDLKFDDEGVLASHNGHSEVFLDDPMRDKYVAKLDSASLEREDESA